MSAERTLLREPGLKRKYSNGIYVAAYLIEKYSGMSYVEFIKTRILKPLGMNNTYFTYKNIPEGRSVPKHYLIDGKWQYTPRTKDWNSNMFAVDAGLYSTAEDLFAWYQMVLNGGEFNGVRLLSKESVAELVRKQVSDDVENFGNGSLTQGLGFILVEKAGPLTKGSWGKGGGGTTIWVEPSTKSIYMMLHCAQGQGCPAGRIKSTFINTAAAAAPRKSQN